MQANQKFLSYLRNLFSYQWNDKLMYNSSSLQTYTLIFENSTIAMGVWKRKNKKNQSQQNTILDECKKVSGSSK